MSAPRVPGVALPFADLRGVTSGWSCVARGRHVIPYNPCDPWGRWFDHPRLWLVPGYLGAGQGQTMKLGVLIGVAFLLCALAVLPREAGPFSGLVYGLALVSPAVMLGIERANVDLVLFCLVVVGVFQLGRRNGLWIGGGLLLFAGALKLAPIFALPVLLRRRGRAAVIAVGSLAAAFGLYILVTWSDFTGVVSGIPRDDYLAYGIRRLGEWVLVLDGRHMGDPAARRVEVALLLLGALAAVLLAWRRGQVGEAQDDPLAGRRLDCFVAGASLYVGSYALTESKDYRLVFTLLTIPQLLVWARARSVVAVLALLALAGTLWMDVPWLGVPGFQRVLHSWNVVWSETVSQIVPLVVAAQFLLYVMLLTGLFGIAWGRFGSRPQPES